jgi:hypothetical protein
MSRDLRRNCEISDDIKNSVQQLVILETSGRLQGGVQRKQGGGEGLVVVGVEGRLLLLLLLLLLPGGNSRVFLIAVSGTFSSIPRLGGSVG